MKSTIELFGKRIKEIRKNKKMTQEKLAEIVDLDCQTISRIETGYYFTSYENLEKLATALEVEIKDFFDFQYLQEREKEKLKIDILNKVNTFSVQDLRKVAKFIQDYL